MFLKSLLMIFLLSLEVYAVTIKPGRVSIDGNVNMLVYYDDNEVMDSKDWIAIYKKGADSEVWSNVLHWNWVNKLKVDEPGGPYWVLPRIHLPDGEYQARFFKENSYVVSETYDFTVKKPATYVTDIWIQPLRPGLETRFIWLRIPSDLQGYLPNPKDWVGIYKVGDSNDFENVISWRWARDVYGEISWIINDYPLSEGDYEVRYFLNNSYTTHFKVPYTVENREVPSSQSITLDVEPYKNNNGNYNVRINVEDSTQNNKNWIGFFKAGKKYVRKNLLQWSYNTLENGKGTLDLALVESEWKGKTLRAVYFENDSYEVMSEVEFTLP